MGKFSEKQQNLIGFAIVVLMTAISLAIGYMLM